MLPKELDSCLRIQLIVARLGERELMNWWNTDIAFKLGGADFLERLLGSCMAPLAAAEAILQAARLKEEEFIAAMPHPERVNTLFVPDPAVHMELTERFRHLKRYPEDLPESLSRLMDTGKECLPEELKTLLPAPDGSIASGETSFGVRLDPPEALPVTELFSHLASYCIRSGSKNRYTLCYYEGRPHAAS